MTSFEITYSGYHSTDAKSKDSLPTVKDTTCRPDKARIIFPFSYLSNPGDIYIKSNNALLPT